MVCAEILGDWICHHYCCMVYSDDRNVDMGACDCGLVAYPFDTCLWDGVVASGYSDENIY